MKLLTTLLASVACAAATEGDTIPAFLQDVKRPARTQATEPKLASETKAVEQPAAPKQPKAKAAKKTKAAKKAKATVEAEEEDGEATPRSIVPARFKAKYADHNGTNGDKLAAAFKSFTTFKNEDGRDAMDEGKLAQVAKANGIDMAKYKDMNNGQKRMNVGNRLRGMLKNGTTVVIGSTKFADAAKALAVQPVKAKAEPKAKRAAKPAAEQHAAA